MSKMHPSSRQVLQLYKDLLRYGQQLKLTDKDYYYSRIRKEFLKNKELTDPKSISFSFKVNFCQFTVNIKYNLTFIAERRGSA